MDDIFLAASPSLATSPYTANFIDALMAPGGRPLSMRRDSAPITTVAKSESSLTQTVTKKIVIMKSTKVQTLGAYCMSCSSPAYYANTRARKLATPRVVAVTRVLSVLAPTRASGISRHSFGQGWMLLTIVGYPLALRCVSSGES